MRHKGLCEELKQAGVRPATPGRLLSGARRQRSVTPGSPGPAAKQLPPRIVLIASLSFPFRYFSPVSFSFLASPFSKAPKCSRLPLSSSRLLLLPLLYLSVQWAMSVQASILFFSHSSGITSSRKPSAAIPVRIEVSLFWASKYPGLASHHSPFATLNLVRSLSSQALEKNRFHE